MTASAPHSMPPAWQPADTPHPASAMVEVRHLGLIDYNDALALQEELVAARAADATLRDVVLLLQHPPVYTIGRTPDHSSLDVPGAPQPVPFKTINRGGQATYHGPGQLIGYPIVNLRRRKRDLHIYLRTLEQALIDVAAQYAVPAVRREGATGVWANDRKIASIGIGVRQWITMHGFALNICNDLAPFDKIVPCGIVGVRMTSLSVEAGRAICVEECAEAVGNAFVRVLHRELPLRPGETD